MSCPGTGRHRSPGTSPPTTAGTPPDRRSRCASCASPVRRCSRRGCASRAATPCSGCGRWPMAAGGRWSRSATTRHCRSRAQSPGPTCSRRGGRPTCRSRGSTSRRGRSCCRSVTGRPSRSRSPTGTPRRGRCRRAVPTPRPRRGAGSRSPSGRAGSCCPTPPATSQCRCGPSWRWRGWSILPTTRSATCWAPASCAGSASSAPSPWTSSPSRCTRSPAHRGGTSTPRSTPRPSCSPGPASSAPARTWRASSPAGPAPPRWRRTRSTVCVPWRPPSAGCCVAAGCSPMGSRRRGAASTSRPTASSPVPDRRSGSRCDGTARTRRSCGRWRVRPWRSAAPAVDPGWCTTDRAGETLLRVLG